MKGLLLKDFYMTWKYSRAYLLIMVIFLGTSLLGPGDNAFLLVYPCVLSSFIPVTLLSYDTQSKWYSYFETLPFSRAQFVSVKYLIGLILGEGVIALVAGTQVLSMYWHGTFQVQRLLELLVGLQLLTILTPALSMPFLFKWGVEKGRILTLIFMGVACGGSAAIGVASSQPLTFPLSGSLSVWILLGAACLYGISWWLSILAYRSRDL